MNINKIIIIGDIHGCYYTLLSLLVKVKYDKDKDKLILLGDYIDRGKNSYEVVEHLISLQKEVGKDNCICLLGNHEYMAYTDRELWKINGGTKTIKSYYRNNAPIIKHHWWFKQLPLMYEEDRFVCCHAGLPKPLIKDNDIDDILWDRKWLDNKEPNEKKVIFGHTPSTNLAYQTANGNIGIDTACVFGHQLCALVITENKYEFAYESKNEKD